MSASRWMGPWRWTPRPHARTIAWHNQVLLRALDDAADLGRAEAGKLAVVPVSVDLRPLMERPAA